MLQIFFLEEDINNVTDIILIVIIKKRALFEASLTLKHIPHFDSLSLSDLKLILGQR